MPPKRKRPNDPLEWLSRAKSDLTLAQTKATGVYLEDLCFHAQQAAEKSLKAVLLASDCEFPYTHDLAELVNLLIQSGQEVPEDVTKAVSLTDYSVGARYPGTGEAVSDSEWQEAIRFSQSVVDWAESRLIP